jgi:antitoxin component of MazEF toxin-antitoxin module
MAIKKNRSIKVVSQSGRNYRETPTIMLRGVWLEQFNFHIGDYVSVCCEDGKLIITPDVERARLKEAETAFMEREMKSLQKRFEQEKGKLHLQFVAEQEARYGV